VSGALNLPMHSDLLHRDISPMLAPLPPPISTSPSLGPAQPPALRGRYKVELCRNYLASGHCAYAGCVFAHGVDELRSSRQTNAPMASGSNGQGLGDQATVQAAYVEQLVDALASSVQGEVAALRASQEANRRLEATLRREQAGRRDDNAAVDAWEAHVEALRVALAAHGINPDAK
jgi:hypothetical protein